MQTTTLTDCIYNSDGTFIEKFRIGDFSYVRKTIKSGFSEYLCSREVKILERVKGLDGVQQIVEQDSPVSFISEYIPGTSLRYASNIPDDYFERLSVVLNSIHKRGVADIDFAHSTDLIVKPDGSPAVIDLESSVMYDPNSCFALLIKPIFDYICNMNKSYIINRKARFLPGQLTDEERLSAENIGILPKFWRLAKSCLKK